ncbi:DUF3800 domain-containing protein [Actinokineospora sp. 24-640]
MDESYCKTCYYVVALLVPEASVRSLSTALDKVVDDASWGYKGLASEAELHGYDLFHAERDWEPLKTMVRARIGVYGKALQAIADQITRIVDTIYFAPSTASRLVQAVDLIAFLHHRIQTETNTDSRVVKANTALWDRIAPRVAHSHCWWP